MTAVTAPPVVLVPGFWLGGWAWDEVAADLRARGHPVTALTLPGLASIETDRGSIRLADHVEAIVAAIRQAGEPVVLAVHSGAAGAGYAASDRVPDLIRLMVYVDTGPPSGAMDPAFEGVELPLPEPAELAATENLAGLSEEQLATFRRRAVPQPAASLREAPVLSNPARLDIPSLAICTAYPAEEYQRAVAEGMPWLAGYADLTDVTWIDLPTSHWPMWSQPSQLAAIIARAGSGNR